MTVEQQPTDDEQITGPEPPPFIPTLPPNERGPDQANAPVNQPQVDQEGDGPSGRVLARYDGPSGRFLADGVDWELGQEAEVDAEYLTALQAQFGDHTWVVVRKARSSARKAAESKPPAAARTRNRSRAGKK